MELKIRNLKSKSKITVLVRVIVKCSVKLKYASTDIILKSPCFLCINHHQRNEKVYLVNNTILLLIIFKRKQKNNYHRNIRTHVTYNRISISQRASFQHHQQGYLDKQNSKLSSIVDYNSTKFSNVV